MRVPEAIVADRDIRAWEMRKAGVPFRKIAAALGVSESTAHAAVKRVSDKITTRLAEDHRQIFALEVERLDHLLQSVWPMTMPQRITDEDGREINLPPSFDAIDRALKIMDRRSKMYGFDSVSIDVNGSRDTSGISLGGKQQTGEVTAKDAAMELMKVFKEAGVLDSSIVSRIQSEFGEIVDAEVLEDSSDQLAIGPGDEEELEDE